jgi:hypothetical protein
MHLPRLGGIYYRGNDERSPELFNGGFYRTAELLVRLVDRNGAPIEFGDAVSPNELSIEFKATRAAGATQQLFSPRTMRIHLGSTHRPMSSSPERFTFTMVRLSEIEFTTRFLIHSTSKTGGLQTIPKSGWDRRTILPVESFTRAATRLLWTAGSIFARSRKSKVKILKIQNCWVYPNTCPLKLHRRH